MLIISSLFIALLVWYNYDRGLELSIGSESSFGLRFLYRYLLFLGAMLLPYALYSIIEKKRFPLKGVYAFLFFISPAVFSLKMAVNTQIDFSNDPEWNDYWNLVFYWPARLAGMLFILFIFWKLFYPGTSFFGLTMKGFKLKPYLLLLLMMVPLIAGASTQPDFLAAYPKLQHVSEILHGRPDAWLYRIIYELSYGSDFISIEVFFRGFLILGFLKFAGKDAILPMACFYCTIHFGKPLGECISSYFGGLLLGVVVFKTGTIYGGLLVHLGIAWLMEVGGYIGRAVSGIEV